MSSLFLQLVVGGRALAGDSHHQGFEGQIVLENFSWQTKAQHLPTGNGLRTTVTHGHVKLSKTFDRASTALYGYVRDHKELDSATLTLLDGTLHRDKPIVLLEMALKKCFLGDLRVSTGGGGASMQVSEDFALSFETGVLHYFPVLTRNQGRQGATTYQILKERSLG